MKQYQIRYKSDSDFRKRLADIKKACSARPHGDITFYLTWSIDVASELDYVTSEIERQFPEAVYYGNEASGNISEGKLQYGINVVCYVFETETSEVELVWVQEGTALSSLQDLWDFCKTRKGLRAVELIPSLKYLETLQIEGNIPDIDPDILIFGGASINYNNDNYAADIIASGHKRTEDGMAVMFYYGSDLLFSSTYVLGWKGLGNIMEVTDSNGKCVNQIDGMPAFSIYEKYLDLTTEDSDTLVFPLIVEEDGVQFIRTPQLVLPDKSMKMFVNIPVGTHLRIAYGDKNTILSTLFEKAREISDFRPQAIKAFSCAGRRLFWGDKEISKETNILSEVAPVSGFYTGGEILKFGNHLKVLNQTLAIVSFREGAASEEKRSTSSQSKSPDKSLVARLAYFVEKVSLEQQESLQTVLGLASEYLSLYYVNLSEHIFKVYAIDGNRLKDTQQLLTQKMDIFSLLHKFAEASVHPDDQHFFLEFTPETLKARMANTKKFTVRFRRDYGSGYQWSEMDVVKYESKDEPANSIIIGFAERDKEIRREQEQRKKLDEAYKAAEVANQSKTRFLFSMSHDIRTPMNAITGFTNIAKRFVDDKEKVLDYLDKIDLAGQQLLILINQVLEMSRIESGRVELDEQPVNIKNSYTSLSTVLAEQAKTKGLDFHSSLKNVTHYHVFADAARMGQITLNLTGNAIKYTPIGGRIDFSLTESPCSRDGYARYTFTIADNGIGMSEEFQKVMFEPFAREKSSTVSKIQGTGLGMTIVKSLVDLIGGEIEVTSKIGKGTRFDVTVELKIDKEEQVGTLAEKVVDKSNFKGRRVMVVEDNELNREIIRFLLEEQGMIVEEAEDGDIAVQKCKDTVDKGLFNYYDFILMDVQMPRMDGYEATAKIRELPGPEGRRVPIIALSANAFEEDKLKSSLAGMDDHIAKPIDVEKLWSTLARFL